MSIASWPIWLALREATRSSTEILMMMMMGEGGWASKEGDGRDIGSKERLLKACFSMAVNLKPQRTSNLGPDPAFHIWKLGSDVTPFRL